MTKPRSAKPLPAPDPRNTWDADIIEEGPDRMEIALLLEESTEIAVYEWTWRKLYDRRMEIWLRLRDLGITTSRMARAYAVNGKSIITPTAITLAFRRHDVKIKTGKQYGKKPKVETVEAPCWCGAQQVQVPKPDAEEGTTRSCGERICHPPLAQEGTE